MGLQINTILVNTGDKLVLIDAGCGVDKFQNTTGGLLGNLAAAGYAPGDIDLILFTHFHFDHLWGISDGRNASLLASANSSPARPRSPSGRPDWSTVSLCKSRWLPMNLKLASPGCA